MVSSAERNQIPFDVISARTPTLNVSWIGRTWARADNAREFPDLLKQLLINDSCFLGGLHYLSAPGFFFKNS